MLSNRRIPIIRTLAWTKWYILLFAIWACLVTFLYEYMKDYFFLHLPWQPVALMGIALSFYLAFKNNAAYDRLWEARKIWGGIVNSSRTWGILSIDAPNYNKEDKDFQKDYGKRSDVGGPV